MPRKTTVAKKGNIEKFPKKQKNQGVVAANKRRTGKPNKFTEDKQDEYIGYLEQGTPKYIAARLTGLTNDAVYKHCERHPDFQKRVDEALVYANENWIDGGQTALWNSAMDGNVVAQQIILYNRDPERWKDQRAVNKIQQNNTNNNQHTDVKIDGEVGERLIEALLNLDKLEEKQENGKLIEVNQKPN